MNAVFNTVKNNIALLILLLFLVAGLVLGNDFGISCDEEPQRNTGMVSYDYVFNKDQKLLEWFDRDYGVAIELPLIMVEKSLGLTDLAQVYHMRHVLTYLLFLAGAWSVYLLIRLLLKDQALAIAGMLLYLLHPRIFADAFYNTKDIPFLSLYAITLYLAAKAFLSGNYGSYIWLGISTGLLINTRIMGVLLLACIAGFMLLDLLFALRSRDGLRRQLGRIVVFLCVTLGTLYISWPYLWTHPVQHLAEAFQNMSRFRWDGNNLLNGELVHASKMPWYYTLYWLGITTPLFYLAAGAVGIVSALVLLVRRSAASFRNTPERHTWLYLISFIAPLVAVAVLHSVLYDGWRQMFFIYPAFVLLAVLGIYCASRYLGRKPVLAVTFLCILLQAVGIARLHPFSNVYFNRLVSREPDYIRQHFEQDYWGLAYRQSLAYILDHDTASEIKIAYAMSPCEINGRILFSWSRLRFVTDIAQADYYVTGYRMHPQDYPEFAGKEWHSIIVNNSRINTVFKLKH